MRASASAPSREQRRGERAAGAARPHRSYPERVRDTADELRIFAVAATQPAPAACSPPYIDDQAPGGFFDFVLPPTRVGDSTNVPITRVRRPVTLRSLVAGFAAPSLVDERNARRRRPAEGHSGTAHMHNARRKSAHPGASAYRLDAASRTLARLANARHRRRTR